MTWTLLEYFDLIGTIAFAISGAFVGIQKKMDIFGVNVLAITTACGGGLMRDIIIGRIPPRVFIHPFYACIAFITANLVFSFMYFHQSVPGEVATVYDKMLFWFDTLGLAAFTVDGVFVSVEMGYVRNIFLTVFLGFMTGVGGGALRDIMADQKPDIFVKNIYASASIAGALFMVFLFNMFYSWRNAMVGAFFLIVTLRCLAAHYHWNLPRVE